MEIRSFTPANGVEAAGPSRPQGPSIIYVPSAEILRETYTIFNLAIAYAGIAPRVSRRRLIDWVYDRIIECEAVVIDHDGIEIDLHRVDVDGIFGDDCSASWAGDFLAGRVHPRKLAASPKIAARIKLLWIALAAHNPAAAKDVLR
ncbi:hypothetical protein [Sphingorhabdus sp.]|uniref:hypothetical protein n=1 Tax=Sphingorhabdus sp. TaxID=1902408 RepID=UPI0032B7F4C3